MNRKKIAVVLWCLVVLWIGLIFSLSSQNGEQTAKTSSGIAEKMATVIYQQPTNHQVDWVHLNIRKLAHVSLFLSLGLLTGLAGKMTFNYKQGILKRVAIVIPVVIISVYGFFDEWHKQFIDGRHFELPEVMLNIFCGLIGIMIVAFCGKRQK